MDSVAGAPGLGLAGKVAVVTGGANGIGRGCVLALAREGAGVVSLDADPKGSEELVALAKGLPGEVVALIGDACEEADLGRAAARAADLGGLDIAVNVAGGAISSRALPVGPSLRMKSEDWRAVVDTTLFTPYLGSRVFAESLIAAGRPGSIINIGASLALRAAPHHAAFAAAKAGVHQLTQSLAFELAPHRIRVNCVAPLFVDTPGSRSAVGAARRALSAATIPLGRVAQPEDIAGAVLFLASEKLASFVTGQVLLIDGGLFCTTLRPPRGWTPPAGYLENLVEGV
jgi:NAD(P)-dependent dehydrogenase (short-subunit alcohol dehydrogenase family)